MELPKFLIEMSEQMNKEDVRCTAEPIWMVCYDKWSTCADGRGDKEIWLLCDDGEYIDTDIEDPKVILDHLVEYYAEWVDCWLFDDDEKGNTEHFFDNFDLEYGTLPSGVSVEKISMQKEMAVVKACLTQDDADYFIERKQHDYAKLYTYVFSMIYCPQMIELRNWIKTLTNNN
jgi:hypothetical protein